MNDTNGQLGAGLGPQPARSMNPIVSEALSYLDACVSRSPLTRQEHLAASQMVQRLSRYCESQEQELSGLKKALSELAKSNDALVSQLKGLPVAKEPEVFRDPTPTAIEDMQSPVKG